MLVSILVQALLPDKLREGTLDLLVEGPRLVSSFSALWSRTAPETIIEPRTPTTATAALALLASSLSAIPASGQYACGLSLAPHTECVEGDYERDCFAGLFDEESPAAPHIVRRDPANDGYGYSSYRLVMLGPKPNLALHVSENAGLPTPSETWTQDEVAREWSKVYAQLPDFVHHLVPSGTALGAVQSFHGSPSDETRTLARYCDNRVGICRGPRELPNGLADHMIYIASSMLIDGSCYDGRVTWVDAGRKRVREEIMLHEIAHLFAAALGWYDDWSDPGTYLTWSAEWQARWGDPEEHYADSFMAWAVLYYPRRSFVDVHGRTDGKRLHNHVRDTANPTFFNKKVQRAFSKLVRE